MFPDKVLLKTQKLHIIVCRDTSRLDGLICVVLHSYTKIGFNMDTKIEPVVIVIESPSPIDILDGRFEGEALSAAIKLANISSLYFRVENHDMLHECFSRLLMYTRPKSQSIDGVPTLKTLYAPFFHLSAHGNENGLQLTSGEFISWEMLRRHFVEYAYSSGYIDENGVCAFPLTLSTCYGAQAKQMFAFGNPKPCFVIVGPDATVSWPDALTAFVVFYHLHISKDVLGVEAVTMMNKAAGLDGVFKSFMNTD